MGSCSAHLNTGDAEGSFLIAVYFWLLWVSAAALRLSAAARAWAPPAVVHRLLAVWLLSGRAGAVSTRALGVVAHGRRFATTGSGTQAG